MGEIAEEKRILVVDDEESLRLLLQKVLSKGGEYLVETAEDGMDALKKLSLKKYHLVLQDLKMPKLGGLELLKIIKQLYPEIFIIIMTAYSTQSLPVEAMREGAFCYIDKPFDHTMLKELVSRAFRQIALLQTMGSETQRTQLARFLVGNSPKFRLVFEQIRRIAITDSTVLISGESGTGKELACQAIHHYSHRSLKNLIKTNCGTFQDALLESELFGHSKGAFTGAIADKQGLLKMADGGTFFLDEVLELSQQTQAKLLRVLENGEFFPLGSNQTVRTNVRFVAATNRNLEEEVKKGRFREDLFYRLNVLHLTLPPLRERKEDIPLLAGHFLKVYQNKYSKNHPVSKVETISNAVIDLLLSFQWPGNIRQLENMIQRALTEIKEEDRILLPKHFQFLINEPPEKRSILPLGFVSEEIFPDGFNMEEHLAKYEQKLLSQALNQSQGNLTKAAKLLGVSFRAIRYKIKKYKLESSEVVKN
ncbi:MAG: sigma-54 dependent transcriptional regulator [Planctomycetota bacterium]